MVYVLLRFSSGFDHLQGFLMLGTKAFGENGFVKPVSSLGGQVLDLQLFSCKAIPTSCLLSVAKKDMYATLGCRCQTDLCKFADGLRTLSR